MQVDQPTRNAQQHDAAAAIPAQAALCAISMLHHITSQRTPQVAAGHELSQLMDQSLKLTCQLVLQSQQNADVICTLCRGNWVARVVPLACHHDLPNTQQYYLAITTPLLFIRLFL